VLASFGVAFEDASVLDLYAGTGALGIEALSRGASRVVFIERAPIALRALQKNIDALGIQSATDVLAVSAEKVIGILRKGPAFDLVLCDPPYADVKSAIAILARIAGSADLARPETVLVLEHAAGQDWSDPAMSTELTRSYGSTGFTVFRPRREVD
jgi:16S rRNA (guanine(966)-N(2))-methyltransferase RsmD